MVAPMSIIGMNLGPVSNDPTAKTLKAIANRSWELIFRQNTIPDCEVCDYLLESGEVTKYGMFELEAAESLRNIGYELAKEKLAPLVQATSSIK